MITIVKLSARRYIAVATDTNNGWRNTSGTPDVDPQTDQPLGYRYMTGHVIAGPASYATVDRAAYEHEKAHNRTLTYLAWKRDGAQ